MKLRLFFALIITVISTTYLANNQAKAEVVERIAAIVNDQIILLSEVDKAAESYQSMMVGVRDPEQMMEKKNEIYLKVLEGLIEDVLLEQQIEELKIKISDREVDNALKRIMKNNNIPDMQTLKSVIKRQGLNWKQYRKEIKKQLRKWQFINAKVGTRVKISDEEVKDAYGKQIVSQTKDFEYRASHILFRVSKTDSKEIDDEQKKRAQSALARVRAGEKFSKLAEELSEGPTAKFGGDLGYFQKGTMVKAFEDAVVNMEVNDVSSIVQTPFGYHIITLADKRPVAQRSFEQMKEEIRNKLREEAMQREMTVWLKQLRRKAYIDIKLTSAPKQVKKG